MIIKKNVMISIIIPTLNEAENIATIVKVINHSNSTNTMEMIIVDGGSQDDTVKIAESLNIKLPLKVINSAPGRAMQMNNGAIIAQGEILLFLHADTLLPNNFAEMILSCMQKSGIVAGAFTLKIDSNNWGLRLVEWGVKWRSLFLQLPYGDQAIFMKKDTFNQVGKFPELPIMEDFEIIKRLKKMGKIAIISDPVITSSRRWLKKGIFHTTILNQIIIIAYVLGISPATIVKWYRS
ncbi:TIGR04283 family arsenosugar biosynthesis glycosyltransferase [Anabaena sp. FACHB-1237]|uniref:TIGR04283 family arsenosugar biosynthesis glycosyltransferase n=1 Tax=Anabaena sp. FACHB-1237 TaxID=2692769 RepID=UPI00168035DB|nr:TIGR04283 family arsenosugar biosynthesis glycosyltransferase [Anabaena sp. FACHB-1237]MBD2136496.1 TIGR04283 family arsenosugar biosynthesis glycosyltransferase [Anabaena sp. FACHB-1237]